VYGDEYRERGGWGAWLGTGNKKRGSIKYRSYDEAVKFVHELGLKSATEWRAYCRGERTDLAPKPVDIPAGPWKMYGDEFRERGGIGAWLAAGGV
jgi:hypothetical protein